MTREEFFKKFNSLETVYNELRENLNIVKKEFRMLIDENAKNLLSVKVGDIIHQKSSGDAFKIYDIYIRDNIIYLSIEYCGMPEHTTTITEQNFRDKYVTEEELKGLIKKREEDNEYQEYLRLKDKFEK